MKSIIALICVVAGSVLYALKPVSAQSNLQGKWMIVSAPKDWKIAPGTRVNVTATEIQVRVGPVRGATFQYAADYSSGNIEATKGDEKTRLGKFELREDTVTIAVGAPGAARPASTGSRDSGVLRWVFRRSPE